MLVSIELGSVMHDAALGDQTDSRRNKKSVLVATHKQRFSGVSIHAVDHRPVDPIGCGGML